MKFVLQWCSVSAATDHALAEHKHPVPALRSESVNTCSFYCAKCAECCEEIVRYLSVLSFTAAYCCHCLCSVYYYYYTRSMLLKGQFLSYGCINAKHSKNELTSTEWINNSVDALSNMSLFCLSWKDICETRWRIKNKKKPYVIIIMSWWWQMIMIKPSFYQW